ncbi:serine hydrolase FSH [Fennellomyces sp. T-0311]|nr:serine hydrolase FSH [Fennellomyces sp. T-0311]
MAQDKPKLRILCLHGMAQNALLIEKKMAGFLQDLKDRAEFVYVNGPHWVMDPELTTVAERETVVGVEVSEERRPYAWWFLPRTKPLTNEGFFYGFRESVEYMKGILLEQGPFDGIIGFSQGACLAGCLAHLLSQRTFLIPADFAHPPLQFVIIAGGFKMPAMPATESKLYIGKVETPSMHIIGELDTVILPERSDALANAFKNPFIFRHAGGHFVPKTAAARQSLGKFMAMVESSERKSAQAHI